MLEWWGKKKSSSLFQTPQNRESGKSFTIAVQQNAKQGIPYMVSEHIRYLRKE